VVESLVAGVSDKLGNDAKTRVGRLEALQDDAGWTPGSAE
jgi:hypothetical protein